MKNILRTCVGAAAIAMVSAQSAFASQIPTWGETFVSPTQAVYLDAITVGGQLALTTVQYDIFKVVASGGSLAVSGNSLWTETRTWPMGTQTFDTHLLLDPSTTYVLALTYSGFSIGPDAGPNDYSNGQAYTFTSDHGTLKLVDTDRHTNGEDLPDFSTTFTPVNGNGGVTATPEPATMSLMATGLFGLAGFARRRKKQQAA